MMLKLIAMGQGVSTFGVQHSPMANHGVGAMLLVSGLGLFLGMRHSTDADHIVALSTIVSKERSVKGAALIGCLWGLGHTITIFAVGSLIILFHVRVPVRLGLAMEFSVAVMLVVLGLLNLAGLTRRISGRFGWHSEPQEATGPTARQPSFPGALRGPLKRLGLFHSVRPLVIGLVHGLAGSAAIALLVLSTIRSPLWASTYLLIFGLGTIVGMMLMTTAIAVPLTFHSKRFARLSNYFAVTSGFVSLCFGSFLMYQLGFVGGLFSHHPHWTPR